MPLDNEADDAILNQDVTDADPAAVTAPTERPKSKRELAMDAVELVHLRNMEAETGIKLIDMLPTDDKGLNPPSDVDTQLEAQLADDVITDTGGRKIRLKIDGVEQDVNLADAVRDYQKGATADKRLEEATRLLREAEERARQPAPAPVPAAVPTAVDPEPVLVNDPSEVKTNLKKALENLYLGDSDDAVSAILQLVAQNKGGEQPTQTPALSIDEIAAQLQTRLAVDTALETVRTDYPDIIANKDIELLTAIKVDQKVAAGTSRATAIVDAAKEVYATLGKTAVSAGRLPTPPSESQAEKLKRKAGMDNLHTANVAATTVSDPVEEDASALIRDAASRRLGQSMPATRR